MGAVYAATVESGCEWCAIRECSRVRGKGGRSYGSQMDFVVGFKIVTKKGVKKVKSNNIDAEIHKSKPAYLGVILSLILFTLFLAQNRLFTPIFYVISFFLLLIPVLFDLYGFQIDKDKLSTSSFLFFTESISISDVKRIGILNVYGYIPFRPFNLDIEAKNGEFIRPTLAYSRNGHDLTRIMILKVRDINPNVEIDPVLLKKYGFEV
jgi:hypothetical protein